MAAESDRPVIVNDILCFVHNFRTCLSVERLSCLIESHFDSDALSQALCLLKQFLQETAGGHQSPTTAASSSNTPVQRLLALFSYSEHNDAILPVFAAADLRSLPLILHSPDNDDSTSIAHVLYEVQQLKRLVNKLNPIHPSSNDARRPLPLARPETLDPNATNNAPIVFASTVSHNSSPESPKKSSKRLPSLENTVEKLMNKKIKQEPQPTGIANVDSVKTEPTENGTAETTKGQEQKADCVTTTSNKPTSNNTSSNNVNKLVTNTTFPWVPMSNGYSTHPFANLTPFSTCNLDVTTEPTNWLQAYWALLMQQQGRLLSTTTSFPNHQQQVSPPIRQRTPISAFSPTNSLPEAGGRGAMDLTHGSKSADSAQKISGDESGFGENPDESNTSFEGLSPTPSEESKPITTNGKSHDSYKDMNNPLAAADDALDKPYICQHMNCHKRFANKFLLKKHEFIHTGERPHQCPFCGKRFNRKDNLLRHKKTHIANSMHNPKRRHTLVFGVPTDQSAVASELAQQSVHGQDNNGLLETLEALEPDVTGQLDSPIVDMDMQDQVPLTCAL